MITVTFKKNNGYYYSFESKGHAQHGEYGEDIVCAAVSVLAQTLVNSIISLGVVEPIYEVYDGYLSCEIPLNKGVLEDIEIQTIFKVIKIGAEGISEVYDKYVELLEEEV